MEGPNLRRCPRTVFRCPIELRVNEQITRLHDAVGNLSVNGLFLQAQGLPVDTVLQVKFVAVPALEVDGVVRFCDGEGVGIQFRGVTAECRRLLEDLIAHFLPREVLARTGAANPYDNPEAASDRENPKFA